MIIRPGATFTAALQFLAIAAHASEPGEWADLIVFIP
jgi:hypothetical protein